MASPTQQDPNQSPPNPIPMATRQFNSPNHTLSFSALLESVVNAANSSSSSSSLQHVSFKGQFGMSHKDTLASVTAKAAQVQHPAEFTNSALVATPYTKKPRFSAPLLSDKKDNKEEGDNRNLPAEINTPVSEIAQTSISDGYSWRKYGQKQVKSSESFRSYYRCTHSGCCAKKKVQHADKFRCIVGVEYKGQHNHDPSVKVKEKNLKTSKAGSVPVVKIDTVNPSANKKLTDSNLSASGVNKQVMTVDDRCESHISNSCHGTANMDVEDQHEKKPSPVLSTLVQQSVPLPEEASRSTDTNEQNITDVTKGVIPQSGQKRRMKDRARAHSLHLQKTTKETKVVVHVVGDVGISADGYRWRKYGQKMVKGNTNPRSYYRCTCAGCPARKHVEKATDNSTATIVTYEGKHDHDKPVPKKQYSSPSSTPQCSSIKATPAAENTDAAKGGDKMIESARTLLSIGIELKSC